MDTILFVITCLSSRAGDGLLTAVAATEVDRVA